MRRILVISAAAALGLAACNKGAPAGGGPVNSPAAKGATPAATANLAGPTRKSGLWQIAMTRDGAPRGGPLGAGIKTCIDASAENAAAIFGRRMGRGVCSEARSTKNPDGSWSFNSTCQMGQSGTTIVTKGTVTGDFNAKYVVHTEVDVSGSDRPERNGHHTMDTTATFVGPCPNGMASGDIELPNGQFINPSRMAGAFGGARGGEGGGSGGD